MMMHPAARIHSAEFDAAAAGAEDALARLDERLAASPITGAWMARTHFADAAASLWLDSELVTYEDLVLHDANADIRSPTHALVRCHAVLRTRRRIATAPPGWGLTPAGLAALRGRPEGAGHGAEPTPTIDDVLDAEEKSFDAELAAIDALIARTSRVLDDATPPESAATNEKTPIIYAETSGEEERLRQWHDIVGQTAKLPPTCAAAIAGAAWDHLAPLQHKAWLGRLLVADLLRARKKTKHHLACLNLGLQAVARTRRRATDRMSREAAWLAAITEAATLGLREHDRWRLARTVLEHKLQGRRTTSKLPQLIELVLARPLITAGIIAGELGCSQRAAQNLVAELGLRELTGRGRYRAWAVL